MEMQSQCLQFPHVKLSCLEFFSITTILLTRNNTTNLTDEGHDHGHKHGHDKAEEMPAWKKKALKSGAGSDPMAAPFGGDWKTEASLSASKDKMEE